MKLFNKMYSLVLALAVVFTLNNCSNDQISPQEEEGISTMEKMAAKKKVSSASGQAGVVYEEGEGGFNGYQSFSFHVTKDVDGNVSGSWQSNYNDSMNDDFDINTHGTIDCVIFRGNNALMAGTITHVNAGDYWQNDYFFAPIEVGQYTLFEVVDNGEGNKSDPDQFSDYYHRPYELCFYDGNLPLNDISNGNIQVKNNESTARKGNSPSASGQGSFSFGDNERRFAFHALTMPDGTVQGNGVLTYTGGEQKIMFDIDCITFLDDHTAAMSGIQTYNKLNPEREGNAIYFKVVDNGEGKKADSDLMTGMVVNFDYPYECQSNFLELPFFELEGGNIQVNP